MVERVIGLRNGLMRKRVITASLLLGLLVPAVLLSRLETRPVRIDFLGYTNYNGRTIALFGVTNLLPRALRGVAFTDTNLAPTRADGSRLTTNQAYVIVGSSLVNTQIVARVWDEPTSEHKRDIWLGAASNKPNNGMTLGLPQPARAWKPALLFPPNSGARANTVRGRLAAFLQSQGWLRLSAAVQPKEEPLLIRGAELPGAQPN